MALTLAKIEAVKFGDFELMPVMDKEQRLRVADLKIEQGDYTEAIDVIMGCFSASDEQSYMSIAVLRQRRERP